jgi:hypothetical protein
MIVKVRESLSKEQKKMKLYKRTKNKYHSIFSFMFCNSKDKD